MKLATVRAWKDASYRANSIGEVELSDSDLAGVYGGTSKRAADYRFSRKSGYALEGGDDGDDEDEGSRRREGDDDHLLELELNL
jgi:hypothetical protein